MDQRLLQRGIDGLVIGDLIVDIRFVERGAAELGQVGALIGRLLGERCE
jgi:hypothetical protein